MQRLNSYAVCSIFSIICLLLFDVTVLTDLGKNTLLKSSLSSLKAFFILTNGTSLDEHGLFFQALSVEGRPVWASASRIPSHVSAVCAQPCVRVSGCVCARALRSHRSVPNLPPRLSKQARADWQAPLRWRHPFIRALTPVSLAPLGRSPWRR